VRAAQLQRAAPTTPGVEATADELARLEAAVRGDGR
jgi:hypothetical protein